MDAEIRKQVKSHFSAAGFTPTAALSLFSLVKKKDILAKKILEQEQTPVLIQGWLSKNK